MGERNPTQSHARRQPDALREALLQDAKTHYSPSASQLEALAARLEPHLQAYEKQHPNVQALPTRRWLRAVSIVLPAVAAAVLPFVHFANTTPPVVRPIEAVAPAVVASAPPRIANLERALSPLRETAISVTPRASTNVVTLARRVDTNTVARGSTREPHVAAPTSVHLKLELPKEPLRAGVYPFPHQMTAPALLEKAPLETAAIADSPVKTNPHVATAAPEVETSPHSPAAPPIGRYGAMQALAVHSPMFPRLTEVRARETAARALPSPTELSPRMSAVTSTVAPWTL